MAPFYGFWAKLVESRASRRAYELARFSGGESVLEVAVGSGEFYRLLLGTKGLRQCVGVDRSAGMLGRARSRLSRAGMAPQNLCRTDARCLPFAGATFDVLFNFYMLDLLPGDEIISVAEEFRRVLRATGRLIILNMAEQARILNEVWMWLYDREPLLVGGCRPVPVGDILAAHGWRIDVREQISQGGFRSDLIVARVPARTA